MPEGPGSTGTSKNPREVVVDHGKRLAVIAEDLLQRALVTAGLRQPDSTIAADAQDYWRRPSGSRWAANSHWRNAPGFRETDLWDRIGADHLALFEDGARMAGFSRSADRVVEWGCGGGANAVHFAPRAKEFIGVDISRDSLDECDRQIAGVCDTVFRPVAVEVANPESALGDIDGVCDVFLSFYVFELIPSPEYGERLLRIAHDLLAPGGLALIQIKYETGEWRTKPRRRSYRRGLANMTTYPIHDFWELAERCGFVPRAVRLVPRNELDERYAYFFLSKE
ncbi:methyltransferase domain-containing protein [Amycolatopsis sp. NPDC089917]|uniref:class I SAM-dependent methyltransferase n=1 Tax=Amycolatopsis sp. NPDC089917 TaxID=3155187 RepID=UPI00341FCBD5